MGNNRLLNKKDVCEILNISRGSLDRLMRGNDIKYVKFERSVRFKEEDVFELINKNVVI